MVLGTRRYCRLYPWRFTMASPSSAVCGVLIQPPNCFVRTTPPRDDGTMSDQLCEYERQRLANIEKNNAMLMQLGIMQQKKEIHVSRSSAASSERRARSRVAQRLTQADRSRASARIAGQPGPEYRGIEEDGPARMPRASLGAFGTRCRADFFATGFNNTVWPSKAEVAAAATKAEKSAADSDLPASVKVMLPSHVSGGYWLQMPVVKT